MSVAHLEGKMVTAKRFNYDGSYNLQGEDNYAWMEYPSDDIEGILEIYEVPEWIYDNRVITPAYTQYRVDGQSAAVDTIVEKVLVSPAAAVAARIRRPMPAGLSILEGSLPVVSFGDPDRAIVATLSLNPSWLEFQTPKEEWYLRSSRRLASLLSIGATDPRELDDYQVARVAAESNGYFEGQNWYKGWFHWLESLLSTTGAGSYLDGSACHLDLVQWATKPAQGRLPKATWRGLLEADRDFLQWQLRNSNVKVVLANGASVVASLEQAGLVRAFDEHVIGYDAKAGRGRLRVFRAVADGVLFLGWNKPLATAIAEDGRRRLTEWVTASLQDHGSDALSDAAPTATVPTAAESTDGFMPAGSHVGSFDEMETVLASWMKQSDELTLGDIGRFGGSPVITVRLHSDEFVINRDTKRAAIESFLQAAARAGGAAALDWHVTANSNGTINRVTYRPDDAPTPGWYAYVRKPLPGPRRLR